MAPKGFASRMAAAKAAAASKKAAKGAAKSGKSKGSRSKKESFSVSSSDDETPLSHLKKPAAAGQSKKSKGLHWQDKDLKVALTENKQGKIKIDPKYAHISDDKDYPEGVEDPRPTSRNQKNTFKHYITNGSDDIRKEDADEYTMLVDSRGHPGKDRQLSIIVNKYTSRVCRWVGELEPKEMTIEKRFETVRTNRHCARTQCGLQQIYIIMYI